MLAIRLPAEIEARLAELAKRTGRTKTFYAREAILTHLEDLGDYYLGAAAYQEFMDSGQKGVPAETVEKELGLED